MLSYEDFRVGGPVWVVQKFSHEREPDGVVKRITEGGQIVLEDGRRFPPRAEGYAYDCCTYLFPAGRRKELIRIIQEKVRALGGFEGLSVLQLQRIAHILDR